ncbi:DUF1244 domain-containing protein [Sphingoaurantiacus capsulatus]|uniref:DUF1244 domain-containing protein n=1 Tax=Sphingoaurantiacus capsulatus TaxID=1771310 RepID=A0ABV7XBH3_9SPHN
MPIDEATRERLEAAAFRQLVAHLRGRIDVQNIDLMGHGGFCRNCLSDWLFDAASADGLALTKDEAREWVYGMPYADYKAKHQAPATDEQLRRMDESLQKNEAYRQALLDEELDESFPASDPPSQTQPGR